ncbi:MAG: leucine-rich repeat protein, partial [Oscillospiraceae bacterium]|nr:leucine-rich repeat protein [Oscillospiraceae bacterium]
MKNWRKAAAFLLAAGMCSMSVPAPVGALPGYAVTASAEDAEEVLTYGGFTYRISSSSYTDIYVVITGIAEGASGALTIPAEIDGYRILYVQEISNVAGITSLTIPAGVPCDGFKTMPDLETVILEDGCTNVPSFKGCSKLTNVVLPDSVTTISRYAFDGCKNLTSIDLPD